MHNVELKAELRDIELARTICSVVGATHAETLDQTDTYYKVPSGRLKRRECTGHDTEYIYYDRADRAEPRLSHYVIYSENAARERFGAERLPVVAIVKKKREVYLVGPVRIHLDVVDHLGTFLEFEAVVSRAHNVRKCHELVAALREHFASVMGEPISAGYADLIQTEANLNAQDADPIEDPSGSSDP
ncbi:MAG TPA: CYTH domain-containing protein [Phycisphaerales bacterium]|nr:CYTH domain-containing protein [Phycisphaerales bacterium]